MHRFAHQAMATTFEIRIPARDEALARDAAETAFEELDRLEKLLSRYNAHSDIGQLNTAPPRRPVVLNLETFDCLRQARAAWQLTGGAFDPTAGKPPTEPTGTARRRVGMDLLALDEETLSARRMDPAVQVDLGGIGKGFALDRLAEILREWDIPAALLHGGQSTALAFGTGPPPGWRLTVENLPDPDGPPLGRIRLADRAVSASSTFASRHITDPRTGRAVPPRRAAWAVAPTAAEADAITTALCVMSLDEIRALARKRPDLSFLVGRDIDGTWQLRAFGPNVLLPETPGP